MDKLPSKRLWEHDFKTKFDIITFISKLSHNKVVCSSGSYTLRDHEHTTMVKKIKLWICQNFFYFREHLILVACIIIFQGKKCIQSLKNHHLSTNLKDQNYFHHIRNNAGLIWAKTSGSLALESISVAWQVLVCKTEAITSDYSRVSLNTEL